MGAQQELFGRAGPRLVPMMRAALREISDRIMSVARTIGPYPFELRGDPVLAYQLWRRNRRRYAGLLPVTRFPRGAFLLGEKDESGERCLAAIPCDLLHGAAPRWRQCEHRTSGRDVWCWAHRGGQKQRLLAR